MHICLPRIGAQASHTADIYQTHLVCQPGITVDLKVVALVIDDIGALSSITVIVHLQQDVNVDHWCQTSGLGRCGTATAS